MTDNIFSAFSSSRIAVIGDLMLDVYLWGQVNRISPEAPVPIVNIKSREVRLGGAANVIRNLGTLQAGKVYAFGAVGGDGSGKDIINLLSASGFQTSGVLCDDSRPTTEKRRVMAGGQQILREDLEETTPLNDKLRQQMVARLIDLVRRKEVDAVIFEDYAKGVLSSWMLEEIIIETRKAGIPTALDPKPGNLTPVRHLTTIKPNRLEAFALAGISDPGPSGSPENDAALRKAAEIIEDQWQPEYLLLSLAAQGLGIFKEHKWHKLIPTRAREVFDVSGAGDTVTATFVLASTAGADAATAAEIANCAAGVVVGKVGTAPIMKDELISAWKGMNR
ncbi:MAG: D-glycero-beta-D-manno-heptose-7-phosphate kinase [Lentisphaeria bacterium]|nr:D-glycero-beta-D-manno-heptose-7-phosphate kinase [Lentisphaeria bacterium]